MVRAKGQGSVQAAPHCVTWEVIWISMHPNKVTGTCRQQTALNSDTHDRHRPVVLHIDRQGHNNSWEQEARATRTRGHEWMLLQERE